MNILHRCAALPSGKCLLCLQKEQFACDMRARTEKRCTCCPRASAHEPEDCEHNEFRDLMIPRLHRCAALPSGECSLCLENEQKSCDIRRSLNNNKCTCDHSTSAHKPENCEHNDNNLNLELQLPQFATVSLNLGLHCCAALPSGECSLCLYNEQVRCTLQGQKTNSDCTCDPNVSAHSPSECNARLKKMSPMPKYYDASYSIFTKAKPTKVMSLIDDALGKVDGLYFDYNRNRTKIQGRIYDDSMSFTIKMFKGMSDGEYLVEMHRYNGSRESFWCLYQYIRESIASIIIRLGTDNVGTNTFVSYGPAIIPKFRNITLFSSEFTDKQTVPLAEEEYRLEAFTSFSSNVLDAQSLLTAIERILRTINLKDSHKVVILNVESRPGWFKVRVAYEDEYNNVGTLVVTLYTATPPTIGHIVEFKRTSGDTIPFNFICWATYDVLAMDRVINPLELKPFVLEPIDDDIVPLFPSEITDRQSKPLAAEKYRLEAFTSYSSDVLDAEFLLNDIRQVLQDESYLAEKRSDWFKIHAAYDNGNDKMGTFVITLYTATPPAIGHIVEFKRTSGDAILFITVCKKVCDILLLNGIINRR